MDKDNKITSIERIRALGEDAKILIDDFIHEFVLLVQSVEKLKEDKEKTD